MKAFWMVVGKQRDSLVGVYGPFGSEQEASDVAGCTAREFADKAEMNVYVMKATEHHKVECKTRVISLGEPEDSRPDYLIECDVCQKKVGSRQLYALHGEPGRMCWPCLEKSLPKGEA